MSDYLYEDSYNQVLQRLTPEGKRLDWLELVDERGNVLVEHSWWRFRSESRSDGLCRELLKVKLDLRFARSRLALVERWTLWFALMWALTMLRLAL